MLRSADEVEAFLAQEISQVFAELTLDGSASDTKSAPRIKLRSCFGSEAGGECARHDLKLRIQDFSGHWRELFFQSQGDYSVNRRKQRARQ